MGLSLRAARAIGHAAGACAVRLKRRSRLALTYAELSNRLLECLVNACGTREVFSALEDSFYKMFGLHTRVLAGDSGLQDASLGLALHPDDLRAAEKAIREGRPAGSGTTVVPEAPSFFIPLLTSRGVVGLLAFDRHVRNAVYLSPEFNAVRQQAALSVLRFQLTEEAQQARVLQETDRLQKALLDSISHNVRTPLASILGSLSIVLERGNIEPGSAVNTELIENAAEAARRLNRLFGNLLDLTRLEAGRLHVRRDPCDVQDVIGAAVEQLGSTASGREIRIEIPSELPFVRMDFVLIVQVIANLLDNALKYSPDDSFITVEAAVLYRSLEVRVTDSGDGIPAAEIVNVFEKFNRAGRTSESGLGLGLSICKGIIEAHHGTIWIRRREPHGTIAGFNLPFQQEAGRR